MAPNPTVKAQKPDPAKPNVAMPTKVSPNWASIGVVTGYDPVPLNDLRLFILGPAGGGKTTFASGSPKTLILDFERGASGIPYGRAHRIVIPNFEILTKVVEKLLAEAKSPNRAYDRVCIDSMCEMADVVNAQLVAEINAKSNNQIEDITMYGTKGAGYSLLRKRTWSIIKDLDNAGYSWTIIDHVTEKTVSTRDSEITVLRPVLFDTFGKTISRAADITCSIFPTQKSEPLYKTIQGRKVPAGTKTSMVYTLDCSTDFTSRSTAPGKQRYIPSLNAKLELPPDNAEHVGWDIFGAKYNKAVAEMKEQLKATEV